MEALAKSKIKNIEISAQIIRANGDIEDLGVIAQKKVRKDKLKSFLSKLINR